MPAYKFVEDILEPWLRETKQDKKLSTLKNDAYAAKILIRFFSGCYISHSKSRNLKMIDGVLVSQFRESELSRGMSDDSVAEVVSKAASACKHAINDKNYEMPNPFAGRTMSRAGRKRSAKSRKGITDRGIWTPEDEQKFYAHAEPFIADVVKFALQTGCRLGEILNLTMYGEYEGEEYQRVEGNTLIFSPFDQKSNFWGSCAMNETAQKILKRQTAAIHEGKLYLFTWGGKRLSNANFSYWFLKARRKAGLKVVFKDTRKTAGQRMLDRGARMEGVQAQLRHESIQTTEGWYVRPSQILAEDAVKHLG